jgi:Flp pilus assembly protein TadG
MRSVPTPSKPTSNRRGAVIVIIAVSVVVLLGVTALCIDIGWITLTKSQLQNVADSAAAAGARQLIDNYSAFVSSEPAEQVALIGGAQNQSSQFAASFGGYNRAGGINNIAVLSSDIQVGFTDANGVFHYPHDGYPNTVQVFARRDSAANGMLPLFFAPVIGMSETSLKATASATAYTGLISSFDPTIVWDATTRSGGGASGEESGAEGGAYECLMLPVAFDVYSWEQFLADGQSPDGIVHKDIEGCSQIKIYPSPMETPGNVGLLCIGPYTNATPDFRKWILNGPDANDLEALIEAGSLPVSRDEPKPWKGTPGLRTTLKSFFTAIIGQPRLLPLFEPLQRSPYYQAAAGVGSNARYNIVGFVGVKVSSVTGAGDRLDITVQPCDVIDNTAIFDPSTLYPLGAEPKSQLRSFTHTSARFTK